GNYTYYPYVELGGDGSPLNGSLTSTTTEVDVDRVKITDIVITDYEYDDGTRFWDNNNGTFDEITITITAVWNYTGKTYAGEVIVGYTGNPTAYGSTTNLAVSKPEDPSPGTSITRNDINVSNAVEGTGNAYGTQVYIEPSLNSNLPDLGWDNADPILDDAMSDYAESGDTDEVYGVIGSNTFYFSDSFNSPATITFTATGTDSDSGVRGIDFGVFGGDNPDEDTSAPYTGQYTLNTDDNPGSITVTIYDNVGNSASGTITCTEDGDNPTISVTGESESSQYLYSGYGTGVQGVYGSGMGSTHTYTISGTASDADSDLLSITDDTSFGDDPSNTGTVTNWVFDYQIDAADNNDVTVTFTATDNVGNTNTASYTFYEDNANPTLSDAMSAYAESGDTDEVYGVIDSNVFYFSNSFDSAATITFTATGSDTGFADIRGIDFGIFGADNPAEDPSTPFTGDYTIDNADTSGSITVTIYDNVGNNVSGTITCTEDVSSPTISVTGESESSQYLYSGYGDGTQGVYGSGMGSTQTYTISGTASDAGSDMLSVTDDTTFGDDPSNTGTVTNWVFDYQIDAADNNDVTVSFTATDNVGNTNTVSYTFFEDNSNPTLTDAMSDYAESGDTDEVYGVIISNTFYFSTIFDSDATITFTATGSDTGLAGVRGIDFGTFGIDNPPEDTSAPYTGQYTLNTDDNPGSITVTIYDNVGNSASDTISCTEDGASPSISITGESESSPYLYSDYGTGIQGVYGSGMGSIQAYTISGTASDGVSGMASVTDDTSFGDDPDNTGTVTNWVFDYQIDAADNNDVTVTYTATDNVGNTNTASYTFFEDNSNPTLTDAMSAYAESGDTDEVFGTTGSNRIYFSNSFDSAATITFTATGSDTGLADIRGIDFGIFGADNPIEDTSTPYTGQYTIDDTDTSGIITVTIHDNVGNNASDTIICTEDSTSPTLSDAMSAYAESGDTDEVYGVTGSNTFYFSNSFDSSATITFTATGADSDSDVRGIDFGTFGVDDPPEDTESPYTGQYTLNTDDTSGSITVTIYDNVGNSVSDTITCTEDAVDPAISIIGESESSQYLYSGYGTGTQGVYGSGMGSTQPYTISGTASDGDSGMASVTDDTSFGDDPGNTGTVTSWVFDYQIDAADNNDVTVTFTATDNVGNTNTASYTFYEDNSNPTL
ncbi:MAG: hypothetical protein JSW00_05875, partial [Thermoplasmata archaeon]